MTEGGGEIAGPQTWQPGQQVAGRYRLVEPLAEGGMGAVYIAEHTVTRKRVALKLVYPHVARDVAGHERFLREAQAPAAIGHEGIVDITDAGVDPEDGTLFLCMELLEGENLRDYLARDDVTLRDALERVVDLLEPLAAAHAKGFVHRDLKPENVFVCHEPDGTARVKLLDFGITRQVDSKSVTQTGMAMGTVLYMSPEQARTARGVTTRSDVWSVGVLLYEILSGHVPFSGDTPFDVVLRASTEPHRAVTEHWPAVPSTLAQLVDRCLSKEPEQRPEDADALRGELRARLADIGEAGAHRVQPDEWVYAATAASDAPGRASTTDGVSIDARPAGLSARSRRRLVVGAAAALTVIVGGVGFALTTGSSNPDGASHAASATESFRVDVTAEPRTATFVLDGERIEGPRLERELPKDGRAHALRIEADGHRTEKLVFTDAAPPARIVLQPTEAETETETETATETDPVEETGAQAESAAEAEARARRRAERRQRRVRPSRRTAQPSPETDRPAGTKHGAPAQQKEEPEIQLGPNNAPLITD